MKKDVRISDINTKGLYDGIRISNTEAKGNIKEKRIFFKKFRKDLFVNVLKKI